MTELLGPNVENVMNDKSERVHALVNAGPWPGMSEAFDAHMGAACWTDPAYAPDASTWAAAWKAGTAAGGAQAVDKANSYILDNARLAEQVENLRAALSEIVEVVSLPREPNWTYRNTITTNRDRIKAACRAGLGV